MPGKSAKSFRYEHSLGELFQELALEWHPYKNGNLNPNEVTPGSNIKVWWLCKKRHEWQAVIHSRSKGHGCPYCSRQLPSEDNNLAKFHPELIKEWHPKKNGSLSPKNITRGSTKKVWWICEKSHEWVASPNTRTRGRGCPYCSGKKVCNDNSLFFLNPQLAKEWHPKKNGRLSPKDVSLKSGKKVWWICKKGHEWQAVIYNRSIGRGCPYCANKQVSSDNCLFAVNPRLSNEWHESLNGNFSPQDVLPNSHRKVWWKCKNGHEWKAEIASRNRGIGCPYCHSQTSHLELRLYTELKSLFEDVRLRHTIFGKECDIYIPNFRIGIEVDGLYWHRDRLQSDKNKVAFLKKRGITVFRLREKGLKRISSNDIFFLNRSIQFNLLGRVIRNILNLRRVDYLLKKRIDEYLSLGKFVNEKDYLNLLYMLPSPPPGYSLADNYKNLAQEWHTLKNGTLTPFDVFPGSGLKAWWICSMGHEWQATIKDRKSGQNCPYCSGKRACIDNALLTTNPELTKEWNREKNGSITPSDVTFGSHKRVWWKCKKGHEWQATIYNRSKGRGCPYCAGKKASIENCLGTINPELALEWHPQKNEELTPISVTPNSHRKVWWVCPEGHEWQAVISSRHRGSRCPYCIGQRKWTEASGSQ